MSETQDYIVVRRLPRKRLKLLGSEKEFEEGLVHSVSTERLDEAQKRELIAVPGVAAVVEPMPMTLIEPVTLDASDPGADADTAPWGLEAVGAIESTADGEGVIVAILDTGIARSLEPFQGLDILEKNFTDETGDDLDGHGTHCAGTFFGRSVEGKRIGVAPGIERALVGKVVSSSGTSSARVVDAIYWALKNKANVISMSLGFDFPGYAKRLINERGLPEELATSIALRGYADHVRLFEAMAQIVEASQVDLRRCVLVAAAGNESRTNQRSDFRISVSPPAAAEGIVSVGAAERGPKGLRRASFSNVGPRVMGPGVAIESVGLDGSLRIRNGTSMAAPHVAGVAALWAQKLNEHGRWKPRYLIDKLIKSTSLEAFEPSYNFEDVGAGIVTAPRD